MKPKTNKENILIIIPIIIALGALVVAGISHTPQPATYNHTEQLGADITPVFPTDFSNHAEDDVIEEEHINILEEVIGITNDTNATSHDYMIRDRMNFAYGTSTFLQLDGGTLTDILSGTETTLTYGLSAATSTFSGDLTFVNATSSGIIDATEYCISGTNCITSWTSADITSVGDCSTGDCDYFTLGDLTLTYGLTSATGTFSGAITTAGFQSTASSTISADFSTGETTPFFVDYDGNIGIATTTPEHYMFEIGAVSNEQFTVSSAGATTSTEATITDGSHGVRIIIKGSTTTLDFF